MEELSSFLPLPLALLFSAAPPPLPFSTFHRSSCFWHCWTSHRTCYLAKKMSNTLSSDEADSTHCHWATSDEGSALCGLCFPQMNWKCNLSSVRGEIRVKNKLRNKKSSIHHAQLVQNFSLHFWLAEICCFMRAKSLFLQKICILIVKWEDYKK